MTKENVPLGPNSWASGIESLPGATVTLTLQSPSGDIIEPGTRSFVLSIYADQWGSYSYNVSLGGYQNMPGTVQTTDSLNGTVNWTSNGILTFNGGSVTVTVTSAVGTVYGLAALITENVDGSTGP